jgi:molybdopterin-guanine dinucleotide biosynthesis protein A
MGRDKALLPFGPNEVLLQRVVRIVAEAAPAERIVCVAGAHQSLPALPDAVQVVRDVAPQLGPLAGLATGLAALEGRAAAVFACGCDAPLVTPAFVARMFDLLAERQIATVWDGEHLHPLSAVYRTNVLPIAQSLLAEGARSLMALVDRCIARRVTAAELRDVDPELDSLANCNTPEDYQRVVERVFPASDSH